MKIRDRYEYTASDKIGSGGFASVYLAFDKLLNRKVALKAYENKGEHKKSLVNEIKNIIPLEHPNLCRYYDVQVENFENIHGETISIEFGIMEYIDGGELDKYLRQYPQYTNKLLIDVLQGLKFLHQKGIIHRDLKPSNVLVKNTENGPLAKIVDFGISKNIQENPANSSSQLMGTPKYMAPEQFAPETFGINGKISSNLDLWTFGLMVYELIAGESLVKIENDTSFSEIVNIIPNKIPYHKIIQLPSPYREVVQICVVAEARERVQDAQVLIDIIGGDTTHSKSTSNKTQLIDNERTPYVVSKGDYSEGLVVAKFSNDFFGYIDHNGQTVIEPIFSMANNFVNGAAQVLYQGKWKVIDRFGNTIQGNNNIPARSTTEKSFFQKNIAAIIIGILVLLAFLYCLFIR